ncbi:MAG: AAA family ATPase, partial [Gammaproteobacteria bacterium]|nr:AAA family ATPase [Gammaproteobacteria bacterium]
WIMNLEDPADEMERRIGAAAKHYGIDQADIEGRLFVDAGRDKPLLMAQQTRDGITIHKPMVDAIAAKIRANRIGVLIVDPFVASHSVSENDNQAINAVLALWRLIADLTGCCIVLVHHFRKLNGEEGSIDSVRGGSAIIGAVRTARVMNTMTEAEAAKLGVEGSQRRRFVRIDNAKNNLAPPADHASWIELVSVDLGNGSGISDQGGDKVGVATPWEPPDVWDGVRPEHLHAVHRHLVDHGPQPSNTQHKEWFGYRVIEILEMPADPAGRARARGLLAGWVKSGCIIEDRQRHARAGREIPVYAAGELKR